MSAVFGGALVCNRRQNDPTTGLRMTSASGVLFLLLGSVLTTVSSEGRDILQDSVDGSSEFDYLNDGLLYGINDYPRSSAFIGPHNSFRSEEQPEEYAFYRRGASASKVQEHKSAASRGIYKRALSLLMALNPRGRGAPDNPRLALPAGEDRARPYGMPLRWGR